MGVPMNHLHGFMPQNLRQSSDIYPGHEEMAGCGVAQVVKMDVFEACLGPGCFK